MLIEAGVVAVAGVVATIYRLKREKIRADRDKALAELALKGAKPSERWRIIDSLAKTKQFSHISLPSRLALNEQETPDDDASPAHGALHVTRDDHFG